MRPGVFRHAVLHDLAERRFSADSTQQVKAQYRSAGFDQELVKAVAAKLLRLVRKVTWEPSGSGWSGYGETCTYDAAGRAAKQAFVDAAVRACPAGSCTTSAATTAPTAGWRPRTPTTSWRSTVTR